jgi:membrane protease YdiL (CAAX protease family)
VVAVALEIVLIPVFLLTGADEALDRGLQQAGIPFNTDLVTAARLVVAVPGTALGVGLAIAQVASPDLALLLVAGLGFGAAGLRAVRRRWRPWAADLGWRRGLRVWGLAVALFTAMNLANGALAWLTLRDAGFAWSPPSTPSAFLAAFLVAMFLDGGALFEESAWRGFCLPLLQARYSPVVASTVLGVLWSAWHMPVKFDLALAYGPGGFLAMFAVLTVKFVLLSLVMAYFVNRAGGSIPLAIAMHGLSNDSARVGGLVDSEVFAVQLHTEANFVVTAAVVAAFLVWGTRGRLGLDASADGSPAAGGDRTVRTRHRRA